MIYFFKGILIGLLFGIPIGAVGALTIQRTITHGSMAGFLSGLGCSTADLCYSCMSIFGFTLISDYLLQYQTGITFIGGLLIVFMGIGFIRKNKWTLISLGIGSVRKKITEKKIVVINHMLGLLVLLFGIIILAKSIYSFLA